MVNNSDIIKTGRYLCKAYYNGELPPAAIRPEWHSLSRCVEQALEDPKNHAYAMTQSWRRLMAGELRKGMAAGARGRILGGWASRDVLKECNGLMWYSIDGAEQGIRENELWLYLRVGHIFYGLIRKGLR